MDCMLEQLFLLFYNFITLTITKSRDIYREFMIVQNALEDVHFYCLPFYINSYSKSSVIFGISMYVICKTLLLQKMCFKFIGLVSLIKTLKEKLNISNVPRAEIDLEKNNKKNKNMLR